MASQNYWQISMENMLSDMGLDKILTKEQEEELISNVISIADMEWEATGQEHIANPLNAEIDRLKKTLKETEKDAEETKHNILGVVAHLGGVRRESVYFDERDKQVKVW